MVKAWIWKRWRRLWRGDSEGGAGGVGRGSGECSGGVCQGLDNMEARMGVCQGVDMKARMGVCQGLDMEARLGVWMLAWCTGARD